MSTFKVGRANWLPNSLVWLLSSLLFFFKDYLIIHERHTERGRDMGRERSRLLVRSLMQNSILGPWDHDLSQRQISTTEPPRCPTLSSLILNIPLKIEVKQARQSKKGDTCEVS